MASPPPELYQECARCTAALVPGALECGSCHALVHASRLEQLGASARLHEERREAVEASATWSRVLELLPPDSAQAEWVRGRIERLASAMANTPTVDARRAGADACLGKPGGPPGGLHRRRSLRPAVEQDRRCTVDRTRERVGAAQPAESGSHLGTRWSTSNRGTRPDGTHPALGCRGGFRSSLRATGVPAGSGRRGLSAVHQRYSGFARPRGHGLLPAGSDRARFPHRARTAASRPFLRRLSDDLNVKRRLPYGSITRFAAILVA